MHEFPRFREVSQLFHLEELRCLSETTHSKAFELHLGATAGRIGRKMHEFPRFWEVPQRFHLAVET